MIRLKVKVGVPKTTFGFSESLEGLTQSCWNRGFIQPKGIQMKIAKGKGVQASRCPPGELHFQQHHATTRAKCCQPGELTPALASRAFIGVQSCRQTLASWSKTSGLSQITHSINSLVPLVPHGSRPQAHKKLESDRILQGLQAHLP